MIHIGGQFNERPASLVASRSVFLSDCLCKQCFCLFLREINMMMMMMAYGRTGGEGDEGEYVNSHSASVSDVHDSHHGNNRLRLQEARLRGVVSALSSAGDSLQPAGLMFTNSRSADDELLSGASSR